MLIFRKPFLFDYIVKSADGTPFKLQFTGYTSDKGKGGYPAFSYAKF